MLHVRCGDDIIGKLKAAGVPGDFLVWADPVAQGPTPAHLAPEQWYAVRSAFGRRAYGVEEAAMAAGLRAADAALRRGLEQDEIVLWFEHDLFDQAILIRLLAWFAARARGNAQLSLVSIDSHPDVPRFIGLGNLDGPRLAELLPARAPVTSEMLAAGARAWEAFTAPTPEPLAGLAAAPSPALPFLAAALQRHLRELPSTSNGLSRTQQLALEAAAAGVKTPAALFRAVQEREEAPWLGDCMFYSVLAELALAPVPLLVVDADWPEAGEAFADAGIALTDAGREVLAERADAVRLLETERWVGGVKLDAGRAAWRWDEPTARPVRG